MNRLNHKSWSDASPAYSATYTYDASNRLVQVSDPTGTYSFNYDNMDRLVEADTAYTVAGAPTATYKANYAYDAASNRKTLSDPQSGQNTYNYYTLNRLAGGPHVTVGAPP